MMSFNDALKLWSTYSLLCKSKKTNETILFMYGTMEFLVEAKERES